jgi:hypothetical protein
MIGFGRGEAVSSDRKEWVLMDILLLVVKRRRRGGKALEGEGEERERILTFIFL